MSLIVDLAYGETSRTLYFSVERQSDGYYWDTSDNTFKAKGSIAGTNDHITLPEDGDETGRYLKELATTQIAQWIDGDYKCIIRETIVSPSSDTLLAIQQKYLKDQDEVKFRLNQI